MEKIIARIELEIFRFGHFLGSKDSDVKLRDFVLVIVNHRFAQCIDCCIAWTFVNIVFTPFLLILFYILLEHLHDFVELSLELVN